MQNIIFLLLKKFKNTESAQLCFLLYKLSIRVSEGKFAEFFFLGTLGSNGLINDSF